MESSTDRPRRREVAVNGVKLSILEAGRGAPVIYVHGVVTTSDIFTNYVGAYSPHCRGIAVDLRGYGNSEKPASGFNLDQFSKDLIGLADVLDIERAVWVGVSMGGMILQRLALDNPSRVRALCLVSTMDRPMVLDENPATIGKPRDYQEVSRAIIIGSFPAGTNADTYQPLLDRIPTWNATVISEALASMARFDLRGQLAAIQAPTLIMVGEKDDSATPAIARDMHAQIRNSKVAEFETGHFMMAEDPKQFGVVLGEFLRGLEG